MDNEDQEKKIMIKAVIVDDVENARISLKQDLEDYCPEVEIIGEADSVVSAAKVIRDVNPELVFLDIHLGDGDGFDLLEILGEINFKIVFTTSSDEHAVQAFRFSAVDYLMKPIDPEELRVALDKIAGSSGSLEVLKKNLSGGPQRIALNAQDKINVVRIEDIVRLESNGSYTMFFTTDGQEILVTRTLKEYDAMLGGAQFIRVHQSHLVNLDFIKEFIKSDGGYLVLSDKSEIPVASRKRSQVMKLLNSVG